MKYRIPLVASTTAIVVALSAPAFAGGLAEPAPTPVITPAPVMPVATRIDWTGPYIGVQLGNGWLSFEDDGIETEADDLLYGVHAGYNFDFGNFVLGGEIDHDQADIAIDDVASLDNVTRAKLRAGVGFGQALVYGTAGAAHANATIGGVSESDTGYFYGAGVQYMLTDRVSIGGEVLQHEWGDFGGVVPDGDVSATTLSARVSMRF